MSDAAPSESHAPSEKLQTSAAACARTAPAASSRAARRLIEPARKIVSGKVSAIAPPSEAGRRSVPKTRPDRSRARALSRSGLSRAAMSAACIVNPMAPCHRATSAAAVPAAAATEAIDRAPPSRAPATSAAPRSAIRQRRASARSVAWGFALNVPFRARRGRRKSAGGPNPRRIVAAEGLRAMARTASTRSAAAPAAASGWISIGRRTQSERRASAGSVPIRGGRSIGGSLVRMRGVRAPRSARGPRRLPDQGSGEAVKVPSLTMMSRSKLKRFA